jgi:hypothetical protein
VGDDLASTVHQSLGEGGGYQREQSEEGDAAGRRGGRPRQMLQWCLPRLHALFKDPRSWVECHSMTWPVISLMYMLVKLS